MYSSLSFDWPPATEPSQSTGGKDQHQSYESGDTPAKVDTHKSPAHSRAQEHAYPLQAPLLETKPAKSPACGRETGTHDTAHRTTNNSQKDCQAAAQRSAPKFGRSLRSCWVPFLALESF